MCATTVSYGATLSQLRDAEVAAALRQALEIGIDQSVLRLGQENGFLGNEQVRIPLPDSIRRVEDLMCKVGLGGQADELVTTMNRAAEQAVPQARVLLGNAARKLTIQEARDILTGPPDAATKNFRAQSEQALTLRFLQIVARETKRLKLADLYNRFANRGVAFGLVREEDADLDAYVTREALDGLFTTLAEEKKKVRENPLDSGKRLVKKVFGAVLPE
jgi:hypothetical protein